MILWIYWRRSAAGTARTGIKDLPNYVLRIVTLCWVVCRKHLFPSINKNYQKLVSIFSIHNLFLVPNEREQNTATIDATYTVSWPSFKHILIFAWCLQCFVQHARQTCRKWGLSPIQSLPVFQRWQAEKQWLAVLRQSTFSTKTVFWRNCLLLFHSFPVYDQPQGHAGTINIFRQLFVATPPGSKYGKMHQNAKMI